MASCFIAPRAILLTLALGGVAYPLAVTALSQWLLPDEARGSLVRDEAGRVVGSALLGQPFSHPAYLHPRPSAAGAQGWDALRSGAAGLGPTDARLRARAEAALRRLASADRRDARPGLVPCELVETSGSGLDPHVSPAAARWQLHRIATARALPREELLRLLSERVEGRELGFLGEPRVNVLLFNRALDARFGRPRGASAWGAPAGPR